MIENMTVGQFIEDILSGGLYQEHCKTCDYWHKRGCARGYVDCFYLQEEFVERILKERKGQRDKAASVPFQCIGCPYARTVKPCIGWCMRRVAEPGRFAGACV